MRELSNKTDAVSAQRWKELDAKQELLRGQIEASERTSQLETELNQVRNSERPNISYPGERSGKPGSQLLAIRSSESYKQDFETYIRTGRQSAQMEEASQLSEQRDLAAASSTIIPQGFEAELIIKLKAYGGMTRLCRTLTTSTGNPLPWPNLDDTSNTGEWLAEAGAGTSADPTFSNVTLGANLLSSKLVKISVQLEQDSAFDIVGLLSQAFAVRLGRTSNKAFTVGDGTATYGTITGLINALVTATGRSVLAVGGNANSGNSADNDLNTVGTDDLQNLIAKVDPAYRNQLSSCYFAANMSTWDTLKKLKDKYGRPEWAVQLAAFQPDTIAGYKYDWNQDMAAIGAGNISVVFGDFNNFVVRNVLGFTLVRFNELFMVNYQRAYQAFMRTDGKLLQAAAFSYLIHPAS
jgi:HK97 family phage major capsid protein